jgi:phospho-N-acetylmuramoyl-pentapeptide-transferase
MISIEKLIIIMGASGLVGLMTLVLGWIGLPLLQRLRVGQTVRDDGPQSHLSKSGTPTFGGFFFLIPLTILGIFSFFSRRLPSTTGVLMILMMLFGIVGFIDDWIKVRVSKEGLSVLQKTIFMLLISVLFALYHVYWAPVPAIFIMPLTGEIFSVTGWFRLPYALFVVLVLYFISNSVNLTDGVDGLAASVTFFVSLGLSLAGLLLLPAVEPVFGATVISLAVAAGCLGFFFFNRHPARVFMGDTGSQALGAAVAGISLVYGIPWILLLAGIIYVAESMSVIIQVIYFRRTGGKRIFRMSPIHHHFELGGWKENRIVLVFSGVTILGTLAGLLMLV